MPGILITGVRYRCAVCGRVEVIHRKVEPTNLGREYEVNTDRKEVLECNGCATERMMLVAH